MSLFMKLTYVGSIAAAVVASVFAVMSLTAAGNNCHGGKGAINEPGVENQYLRPCDDDPITECRRLNATSSLQSSRAFGAFVYPASKPPPVSYGVSFAPRP
jgi:hypothetical protein